MRVSSKAKVERGWKEREQCNKIPPSTDQGRGKVKWSKTAREHSMGFKYKQVVKTSSSFGEEQ